MGKGMAVFISFFCLCAPVLAQNLTIFDSRKPISMVNGEVTPQDYLINGGTEKGLRPGMVITVTRAVPLYDSYQNRNAGNLNVQVARVKIIHAQDGLSVARHHSDFKREDMPILEDPFILVGDRLDLESITPEKK